MPTKAVEKRQKMERQIVRRVVKDLVSAGFLLNIDNGGDGYELPKPINDVTAMLRAMFATDEERLYVFRPGSPTPFGWVYFVYGNDGWDVLCDNTMNLEPQLVNASKLADKLSS